MCKTELLIYYGKEYDRMFFRILSFIIRKLGPPPPVALGRWGHHWETKMHRTYYD